MAHIAKEKREDAKPSDYKSVYDPGNGENPHLASNQTIREMEEQGVYDVVPPTRAQLDEAGNDYAEYVRKAEKDHAPVKLGKLIAILFIGLVIVAGAIVFLMGGSIISVLADGLPGTGVSSKPVEVKGSEMTDDERQMLAAAGYNPDDYTETLKDFLGVYLTYSPGSLDNGQWHDNVAKYVDKKEVEATYAENDLQSHWLSDTWASEMAKHPSAISNLESIDDVEWYMTEDDDGRQVPFCFVRATLTRPAVDYYGLNSPACSVCRFQDDYNVYFTVDGDVYRIRRIAHSILESDLESELTEQDAEKMQKERDSKKDAIDYEAIERQKKAEAAAKKKAEEEAKKAEEAAKKEEEARKKKEEAEARKKKEEEESSNSSSGNNSGGNSNGNSGGNSNGNSGGSSNVDPTPPPAPEPEPEPEPEPTNTNGNANNSE